MKRLRQIAALILCFLVVCAAGCGGNATTTPSSTPTQTVDPLKEPQNGGSISIAMPETVGTWNPLLVDSTQLMDVQSLIYNGLVRMDESMRPQPSIAQNWTTEDDGLTWTLTLQANVKFHDGSTCDADDVIATLDLLKDYAEDSTANSPYEGAMDLLSSYEKVDDRTIKLVSEEKGQRVISALTFPILPSGYAGENRLPSGTGPYYVEEQSADGITLKANENGFLQRPYIDTIQVKPVKDTTAALSGLSVNMLDIVHTAGYTGSAYRLAGCTTLTVMTNQFECIIPNVQSYKLSSLTMRQAVYSAIDQKRLITDVYVNNAVLVDVPVAPDSYLYDNTAISYGYNLTAAKEYLKQAGYVDTDQDGIVDKGGVPLTLKIIVNQNAANNVRADAARLAAQQLEEAGIATTVEELSFSAYQTALRNGDFDLAFCGFEMPADFNMSFLLSSGSSQNYGGYTSGEMDRLLAACTQAIGEEDLKTAYAALQQEIVENLPIFSLYFRTNTLVVRNTIKNVGHVRDRALYDSIIQWYMYEQGEKVE